MSKNITLGTDNVFRDLGLPNPTESMAKVKLAVAVNGEIDRRKLTQANVSKLLKIPQPRVSSLRNYRLDHFSVEKLIEFLALLGNTIEIRISPTKSRSRTNRIRVTIV